MNFTWQEMVFVFVSGILLVLIPSIIFTRRARAEKKAKTENDNAFTTIIEWLDRMELSGVSLLSKLVVLFAPVPVAVQTKGHAKTYLGIEGIGGWILAFVVEALGYAADYRLLQFIQYNKNLEAQRQAKIVNLQGVEKKRALEKQEQFKSSHWDEPNILVHLRMNTRTDSEGNKVLFLEEVQSDFGQKGKKDGFVEKIDKNNIQNVGEAEVS